MPQNNGLTPPRAGIVRASVEAIGLMETQTGTRLVWALFGLMGIFLLGAAVRGLIMNDFQGLERTWSVVGPIVGAIVGHYWQTK